MNFCGKNLVVTGGLSGIGYELCRRLLEIGISKLAILDINENNNVVESLKRNFPNATILYLKTDISQKLAVAENFKKIVADFKRIDIVVNSAGVTELGPEKTIEINLLGVIYVTTEACKYFSKENGGQGGLMVTITSILGLEPDKLFPYYSASKGGAISYIRSIAEQEYFAQNGINFMIICPGLTATPMTEVLIKDNPEMTYQTVDECAENIINAMKVKLIKNCSIWLCDRGNLSEIIPTYYRDYKKIYKK